MKELSIKEKAYDGNYKAYTELINRLEDVKGAIKKQNYGIAIDVLCKPYPEFQITTHSELKESEDEKIRKEIMSYIKSSGAITNKQWIAWLEKQGEDEYIDPDTLVQQRLDALADIIADQKPTNKVEPKFKVGDWTVSNLDRKARQISEVHFDEYNSYYVIDGKSVNLEEYNRLHHLWTIQDAKDGDVLVADNGLAFIYNGYLEEQQWPFAYGGINIYGRFNICDGLLPFTHKKVVPATKEQCDALIKAMTNAGYECDAEKKELKKIESTNIPENFEKYVEHLLSLSDGEGHSSPAKVKEVSAELFKLAKLEQNPVWSEEDETTKNALINLVEMYYGGCIDKSEKNRLLSWLKSLKDRVQPKQEWSEEDEYYRNIILYCLNNESVGKADKENAIKWFKSLRPQNTWKPSDEQLNNLLDVLSFDNCTLKRRELLESLYNDLKKLREK